MLAKVQVYMHFTLRVDCPIVFFITSPSCIVILETHISCAESRTIEVPSSRIVIIEGIYALSEKLRPLLDLRVSVTGGVHFDLVKRVFRDIQRAGQAPQEIIHQISETVHSRLPKLIF